MAKWIAGKKEAEEQKQIDLLRQKERNEKANAAKQIAEAVQKEHSAAIVIAQESSLKAAQERRDSKAEREAAEKKAQLIDKRDEEAAAKKHDEWLKEHATSNKIKIAKGEAPDIDDSFEKEIALIRARAAARAQEMRRLEEEDRKKEAAEQASATLLRAR
jgi:hypothetical protein